MASVAEMRARRLRRLEMLLDVVYAIIIWRIFMLLPRPTEGEASDWNSILDMLMATPAALVGVLIGIVIVIVYWEQSNTLFGHLDGTDSRHTTLSILQLFSLLLLLYAIGLGLRFEPGPETRVLESATTLLVGVFSYLSWRHATGKGKLISADLTPAQARALSERTLAEPLTAAITIPFAFAGPWAWEAAWFIYPVLRGLFRRRADAAFGKK